MSPWKPALVKMKPFGAEFDRNLVVESQTGGRRYTVNLHSYTCTCPDFIERRTQRPLGDLGRSCKHLREVVLSLDTDAFGDELTRTIFKSPHGPYDRFWFAPGPGGEIIAVGLKDDGPWANLFVRRDGTGPYDRFGYHPVEKRWAYDSAPSAKDDIIDMLQLVPEEAFAPIRK